MEDYADVALSEELVLARTRANDLESVKKLNFWGSDIRDISIVRQMPNLEVCSVSVNRITTLEDFSHCPNLQELYVRKNEISDLSEINHLATLPRLRTLWLADNPCADGEDYRTTVLKTLPNLQKLDNVVVTEKELETITGIPTETRDDLEDTEFKGQDGEASSEEANEETSPRDSNKESSHDEEEKKDVKAEEEAGGDEASGGTSPKDSVTEETDVKDEKENAKEDDPKHKLKHSGSLLDPVTMSWEETNKIRQDLGLKPLPFEKMTSPKPVPNSADLRNAHVLQAVLILVRELDTASLEIVESAVKRRLNQGK